MEENILPANPHQIHTKRYRQYGLLTASDISLLAGVCRQWYEKAQLKGLVERPTHLLDGGFRLYYTESEGMKIVDVLKGLASNPPPEPEPEPEPMTIPAQSDFVLKPVKLPGRGRNGIYWGERFAILKAQGTPGQWYELGEMVSRGAAESTRQRLLRQYPKMEISCRLRKLYVRIPVTK